jgi:hypothetical protein
VSKLSKKWIIGSVVVVVAAVIGVFTTASILAKRFDPYIREQAIAYLSKGFDSEVEIGRLTVHIPKIPFMKLFWSRGRGVIAEVKGEDIVMRHKGRRDVPPMFNMKRFRFEVDLGEVFAPTKRVSTVYLEQMEIQIPPKGERPKLSMPENSKNADKKEGTVFIGQVVITDSKLVILPRDKTRKPLDFDLHRVVLDSDGLNKPLRYKATLTNARPPGLIDATGHFGPWNIESPGDTGLDGKYTFNNADLGVFPGIQGTLNAQGSFKGELDSIETQGEADVPDFRLREAGNPVALHTTYEALVDGTNGNTTLKPVHAQLGTTSFTTSGAILKRENGPLRSIDLQVDMPDGEMLDLLRLAMKGKPIMSGRIQMKATIRIPPWQGTINEKLILDGSFHIKRGQFLMDVVQEKVDTLSRRGQGQPTNQSIDDVFSDMAGEFHMENQSIKFKSLTFGVPGSKVELAGDYNMASEALDFRGALRLDAHVSQTMTGWKRWLLKPVDPFFAKNGAGTYLKIKVSGTTKDPHFGPDH